MSFSTNRFSRKALLLVTAVFSASLLWAQATGISGRVLDETGALQNLLSELSDSGASIVTINQSAPENGTAVVSVTLRTDGMPMPIDDVLLSIQNQRTVVSIRRMANER